MPKAQMPSGLALHFTLVNASPDFHEKVQSLQTQDQESSAAWTSSRRPSVDGSDGSGITYSLASWGELEAMVRWFGFGCQADNTAQLLFSPLLSKENRAAIHELVESKVPWLQSFAEGLDKERRVSVVGSGFKLPLRKLTDAEQAKVVRLYRWAKDAGIEESRDQLAQRVATGALTADLNDLYTRKAAEQEAVAAILAAIDSEDLDAVRTAAAENRKALVAGAADYESRHLPLHLAASRGLTAVMEILLEAGASAEARDGFGNTALQVARKEEQCDAEGILLRVANAHDPDADTWPGASKPPTLGDSAPTLGDSAAGASKPPTLGDSAAAVGAPAAIAAPAAVTAPAAPVAAAPNGSAASAAYAAEATAPLTEPVALAPGATAEASAPAIVAQPEVAAASAADGAPPASYAAAVNAPAADLEPAPEAVAAPGTDAELASESALAAVAAPGTDVELASESVPEAIPEAVPEAAVDALVAGVESPLESAPEAPMKACSVADGKPAPEVAQPSAPAPYAAAAEVHGSHGEPHQLSWAPASTGAAARSATAAPAAAPATPAAAPVTPAAAPATPAAAPATPAATPVANTDAAQAPPAAETPTAAYAAAAESAEDSAVPAQPTALAAATAAAAAEAAETRAEGSATRSQSASRAAAVQPPVPSVLPLPSDAPCEAPVSAAPALISDAVAVADAPPAHEGDAPPAGGPPVTGPPAGGADALPVTVPEGDAPEGEAPLTDATLTASVTSSSKGGSAAAVTGSVNGNLANGGVADGHVASGHGSNGTDATAEDVTGKAGVPGVKKAAPRERCNTSEIRPATPSAQRSSTRTCYSSSGDQMVVDDESDFVQETWDAVAKFYADNRTSVLVAGGALLAMGLALATGRRAR